MELKGRLALIAEMVPKCINLCDIGTDHAYIPIYLAEKGVCEHAVAADVKKGPILAALGNIERYGLEDSVRAVVGYGLEPVGIEEIEVIVIAGMGGTLIKEILTRDIDKAHAAKALILQPMNTVEILRGWLHENGFDIYDEALAAEGQKIYDVMAVVWDGINRQIDEADLVIGRKLIEKRDKHLKNLVMKKLRHFNEALKQIQDNEYPDMTLVNKFKGLKDKMNCILTEIEN